MLFFLVTDKVNAELDAPSKSKSLRVGDFLCVRVVLLNDSKYASNVVLVVSPTLENDISHAKLSAFDDSSLTPFSGIIDHSSGFVGV